MAMAALSLILFAGCGSDSDKTTTTMPTTTTAPDPRVDKDRAQKIVLTSADMPGGFTQSSEAKEAATDAEAHALNQCVGIKDDATLSTIDWDGASFDKGNNSIGSNVRMMKSAADARSDLEAVKSEKARNCIRDYFEKIMKAEIGQTANLTTTVVNLDKLQSPDTAAIRVKGNFEVNGSTAAAYFDFINTVVDRAEVSNTYVYVVDEPPADVQSTNLDKVRQRARDALGIQA